MGTICRMRARYIPCPVRFIHQKLSCSTHFIGTAYSVAQLSNHAVEPRTLLSQLFRHASQVTAAMLFDTRAHVSLPLAQKHTIAASICCSVFEQKIVPMLCMANERIDPKLAVNIPNPSKRRNTFSRMPDGIKDAAIRNKNVVEVVEVKRRSIHT